MENPENKEVIDALNVILEGNMLSNIEKEFIVDCINNSNPIEFLQKNILNSDPNAISIYNKLEKYYNDLDQK